MGRGNVCVFREYEGLYYIDNDYLHAYHRYNKEDEAMEMAMLGDLDVSDFSDGWEYDESESYWIWQATLADLKHGLKQRFKSLIDCDEWVSREEHAILENALFYIVVQDNQWSMAVKLIQKEDDYMDFSGLQKRHYQSYLDGIRDVLFEKFETLGTYGGAWTSGRISRADFQTGGEQSA